MLSDVWQSYFWANIYQAPPITALDNQLSLADIDIIKVVGKGNGGVVQLVQHKWTNQFFALKVFKPPAYCFYCFEFEPSALFFWIFILLFQTFCQPGFYNFRVYYLPLFHEIFTMCTEIFQLNIIIVNFISCFTIQQQPVIELFSRKFHENDMVSSLFCLSRKSFSDFCH